MKKHTIKFPKVRVCSIGEMVNYATMANGVSKQKVIQRAVAFTLSNIAQLNRVPNLKWAKRKVVIRALEAIDRVGITDTLELVSPNQSCARFAKGDVNEMKWVANELGLHVYKIDSFVCVTRTPMTMKAPDVKSLAEMEPAERGNSSPELPLV